MRSRPFNETIATRACVADSTQTPGFKLETPENGVSVHEKKTKKTMKEKPKM